MLSEAETRIVYVWFILWESEAPVISMECEQDVMSAASFWAVFTSSMISGLLGTYSTISSRSQLRTVHIRSNEKISTFSLSRSLRNNLFSIPHSLMRIVL